LGVPDVGTASISVLVPVDAMVCWLLEQELPSESSLMMPGTTVGEVRPTMTLLPPDADNAVHP
jgi:hypothetical protein